MSTNVKPTLVLVHGAFAESSSWEGVISKLLPKGYPIVAAANPLRGVKSDTDYIASVLQSINGPIVLVGHSYGTMVFPTNSNVIALVYVAGLAPDLGEAAGDLVGRFPGSTLNPTLLSVPLPDGNTDLYIQQDKFWAQFAADVPEAQAKVMAATQRPIVGAAFTEPSGTAAWKSFPSWFIFGELDKNIPAAVHHFMAERASAKETVEIKGASHVIMISHPDAVAKLVETAAQTISTEK